MPEPGNYGDQVRATLAGAVDTHSNWETRCRAGGIIRTTTGMRIIWRGGDSNRPTTEQRVAASASVESLDSDGRHTGEEGWRATCPCCTTTYDMPSVWGAVRDTGVCSPCRAYADGETDGVLVWRAPTIEEVMALDPHTSLQPAEVHVLRDAYMKLAAVP